MVLVASGFYYMNQADPDCGETFIWTSRAFGAPLGWIIGFAAVASSVIVMSNLVYIAAQYMFYMVGMNAAGNSTLWTTVGGVAWIVVVGVFVAIGIKVSARAQYVLMALQMIPMVLFTVWALIKGYATHPAGFAPIRLSWFFTTHVSAHALAAGVVLAVFLYWGWDTVLAVNEESEDSSHMPGVSAVLNTIILGLMYVADHGRHAVLPRRRLPRQQLDRRLQPARQRRHGRHLGQARLSLPPHLGGRVGPHDLLPLTRQALSMAAHKSLPAIFGRIHPKYLTPFWGTVILSVLSILWYVLVTVWNANAIWDAISALGIMVCIAYGGTGLACTIYYRKELLKSAKNFFLMGVAPTVGAILFALILVKVVYDDYVRRRQRELHQLPRHRRHVPDGGRHHGGRRDPHDRHVDLEARVLQAQARDVARRRTADPLRRRADQRVTMSHRSRAAVAA